MHSTTTVKDFFGLGAEQNHETQSTFTADHPEVFAAEDNGITPIEYLLVGLDLRGGEIRTIVWATRLLAGFDPFLRSWRCGRCAAQPSHDRVRWRSGAS